jgi:hypothetical protein
MPKSKVDSFLEFHCCNCGCSVLVRESEYSGAYDIICEECEAEYAYECQLQQEEFLKKVEPYLYDNE